MWQSQQLCLSYHVYYIIKFYENSYNYLLFLDFPQQIFKRIIAKK